MELHVGLIVLLAALLHAGWNAIIKIKGEGALRKMFVDKDFRGADKGVAIELLNRLLVHATEKGRCAPFL
jgi:hypothetical protein